MTEEDFRRKWRGAWMQLGMDTLAVLQGKSEALGGNKADALLELPGKIDSLLSRIYRELKPPELINGKPAPQPQVKK